MGVDLAKAILVIEAASAVLSALIGIGVVLTLGRAAPGRRCDDPAADPHAEPYGEMPGFSARELDRYQPRRAAR